MSRYPVWLPPLVTMLATAGILIFIVAVLAGCGTYCDNPRSMACMSAEQIERELESN